MTNMRVICKQSFMAILWKTSSSIIKNKSLDIFTTALFLIGLARAVVGNTHTTLLIHNFVEQQMIY